MCVYYILHTHLLIINEILEMFTWKTNVLSAFSPLLYPNFLIFSCILFFDIWDPCISLYILWKPAIKTIIIIIIIGAPISTKIYIYICVCVCFVHLLFVFQDFVFIQKKFVNWDDFGLYIMHITPTTQVARATKGVCLPSSPHNFLSSN